MTLLLPTGTYWQARERQRHYSPSIQLWYIVFLFLTTDYLFETDDRCNISPPNASSCFDERDLELVIETLNSWEIFLLSQQIKWEVGLFTHKLLCETTNLRVRIVFYFCFLLAHEYTFSLFPHFFVLLNQLHKSLDLMLFFVKHELELIIVGLLHGRIKQAFWTNHFEPLELRTFHIFLTLASWLLVTNMSSVAARIL